MITETDAGSLYLCEIVLSRVEIDHYKGYGTQKLLQELRGDNPIVVESTRWRRKDIFLVTQGCHRSTALYELGLRKIPVDALSDGKGRMNSSSLVLLLGTIPILGDEEYRTYYRNENGSEVRGFDF